VTAGAFEDGERNRIVALAEGFQDAFLACSGIALLGAILAATLISSRDSSEQAKAAQSGEVEAVPVAG